MERREENSSEGQTFTDLAIEPVENTVNENRPEMPERLMSIESIYDRAEQARSVERQPVNFEEVLQKVQDYHKLFFKYDDNLSLFKNKERAEVVKQEAIGYLRAFSTVPPEIALTIDSMKVETIKPRFNYRNIRNLLTSTKDNMTMDGSEYMSIFKAQKYLFPKQQDITEIKNFFHVINMNDSSVLLHGFKDNLDSLKNIILGLVKIAFAQKEVLLKYEYKYKLIYKNQLFDNVFIDLDYFHSLNKIVFIKHIPVGEDIKTLRFECSQQDLQSIGLEVIDENARSSDDMVVGEYPEPVSIFVSEDKSYEMQENLVFTKEVLKKFIKDEIFCDKIFSFIDGAILIYPEIMEELPENISLSQDEFHVFEYMERFERRTDDKSEDMSVPANSAV